MGFSPDEAKLKEVMDWLMSKPQAEQSLIGSAALRIKNRKGIEFGEALITVYDFLMNFEPRKEAE